MAISVIFNHITRFFTQNLLIVTFFIAHLLFAVFLGPMFALAPDEVGYVITFNKIYTWPISTLGQTASGWIAAPTVFLWIVYLPAKLINLLGVADLLSVRILSITLATVSICLLKNAFDHKITKFRFSNILIFFTFCIPSIFLWTSVGLRESFIIAEFTSFLVGFHYLFKRENKRGYILLFLGSYGLISTKNYLWVCLMIALVLSVVIFYLKKLNMQTIKMAFVAGFFVPLVAFTGTTSAYALDFIFNKDIESISNRSGDSVTQVSIDVPQTGSIDVPQTGSIDGSPPEKELVTFHGDYSLIALHFYLLNNSDSVFSNIFRVLHLDRKIQSIWDDKLVLGLLSKDKQVGADTSSLNGHILKPAKLSEPSSVITAAFVFLFGPFPLIGNPGLAASVSSWESPLWWAFYSFVVLQIIKARKVNLFDDPQIILVSIFIVGEIVFSALVEVNLGTAFRHRSILLVPLLFLYLRVVQLINKQKSNVGQSIQ